jgi:serine protease inhibitor
VGAVTPSPLNEKANSDKESAKLILVETAVISIASHRHQTIDATIVCATETRRVPPFSVSATLLLLMMGTNGSSKTQLRSALFKKAIPPCDLNHRYKTLQRDLISKTHDIPEMQLSIVNQFFVSISLGKITIIEKLSPL